MNADDIRAEITAAMHAAAERACFGPVEQGTEEFRKSAADYYGVPLESVTVTTEGDKLTATVRLEPERVEIDIVAKPIEP